jgi:hypothetical protein
MPPQPALRDRTLQAGTIFSRRAARREEGVIHQLDMDPAVLHRLGSVGDLDQFARRGIGISEVVGSTNFMGSLLSISKNFDVSQFHGKTRNPSQDCTDVWGN